jgi:iron complex outermembrane receptor protein
LLDSNGDGLGDRLPGRVDPRLNLNNQSWSSPFEADSVNAQLALNHRLNADWQARFAVSEHRTRINDYLAFPDGCSNEPTYVYPGLCANGDVDIYDYRSEDEVRRMSAWDARLEGKANAFGLPHRLRLGLAGHVARSDLPPMQSYNYVGTTNIFTPIPLPADPTLSVANSNSRERAVAAYASAVSDIATDVRSFIGLRVTDLSRHSARSDGSDIVDFSKLVSTPGAGLAWSPHANTTAYVSWGQGIELDAVPNRPTQFSNYGASLPALKSEQTELGWKWQAANRLLLTAALFSIDKPFADDLPQADGTVLRVAGGKRARHRGVEFSASGRIDEQLSLQASATLLDARYVAAIAPALVGQRITNVPRSKTSLFADYKLRNVQGLAINALLTAEQGKRITADGSLGLPDAWQIDLGLRYQQHWGKRMAQWNLVIENLTDRNYWREAPTQSWGGIYLFPATPRTARASLSIDF